MSNFRLNLPVDIPWKLIDSSDDMMDRTFCNRRFPTPFRSSLAIYAYEPKAEELPPEWCGDHITYLKVSCTITGYQPSEEEKGQIIRFLEVAATEVDYATFEQIVNEYFGCYGVLLNVSVHPFDKAPKEDDLDRYPRIIDFEPKVRDFYQAASETGEVLTSSNSKLATTKSFGSTEMTENSWQAEANASMGPEEMKEMTGVPVGIGTKGTTGQKRTETDQEGWSIATDASRERKERQATTTELSQMYNLLTGYHTGTNRSAFLMLPRPHILQPTDRRTFVQGLRVIEGIQDFFLVVVRPRGQDKLKVDAHLQTGHFPENINVPRLADDDKYDRLDMTYVIEDSFTNKYTGTIFGDGFVSKPMSETRDVVDEASGWEADPTKGDPGHGGVRQIINVKTVTIKEVDFETGQVLGSREKTLTEEDGDIENVKYDVIDGKLVVSATLELRRRNAWEVANGTYSIATFSRAYQVFLRRPKVNAPVPTADIGGLLITQRNLCVQISFGECIRKIPFDGLHGAIDIVNEVPFDVNDLYVIPPSINVGKINGNHLKGSRFDFAFKKGILRKLQRAMITSTSSPFSYKPGSIGYMQTHHFQMKLLKVLPSEVLDRPLNDIGFISDEVKQRVDITLREFLATSDTNVAKMLGISFQNVRELRSKLLLRYDSRT